MRKEAADVGLRAFQSLLVATCTGQNGSDCGPAPRVSRSRAGAVRFPSDWGVTQFLVDVTLDASQRHHSKLICRTAKRLENPDPRGGRGRFCKRAPGLEDLMEPALIK